MPRATVAKTGRSTAKTGRSAVKTTRAAAKAAATGPLRLRDHRTIVEFVIQNRMVGLKATRGRGSARVLARSLVLARTNSTQTALLTRATRGTREIGQLIKRVPQAEWRAVQPVFASIVATESIRELRASLTSQARQASLSAATRIGLRTARAILADGRQTIYNPRFWAASIIFDPRNWGGGSGFNTDAVRDALGDKVLGTAKADAVGAVSGAVAGARTGGVKGAVQGAIDGAISASVSSAVS